MHRPMFFKFAVCFFRYLIVCATQLNNSHMIDIVSVETTLLNVTEIIWSINTLPPGSR